MADFTSLSLSDDKSDFITNLNAQLDAYGGLLATGSHTNIKENAYRFNETTQGLEKRVLGAWVSKPIAVLATGSLDGTAFSDNSIKTNKLLASNNVAFEGEKADSSQFDLLKVNTSNVVEFNTPTSFTFKINGTSKAHFNATELLPEDTGVYKLGSTAKQLSNVHTQNINDVSLIVNESGNIVIEVTDSDHIYFKTNGVDALTIDGNGQMYPVKTGGTLLGSNTNPFIAFYTREIQNPLSAQPLLVNGETITFKTSGTNQWLLNAAGTYYPDVDDTKDVGSPSFRVRTVYSNQFHGAGAATVTTVGNTAGDGLLGLMAGNSARYLLNNSTLYPAIDNTYDIGAPLFHLRDLFTRKISCTAAGELLDLIIPTEVTSGAETGQFAKIKINGVIVKIKLYADT